MPEALKITEDLSGLRPRFESPLNAPGLADCRGWRPGRNRLSAFRLISELVDEAELSSNSITVAHPFPQVFISAGFALLCDEDRIFSLDLETRQLTEYAYYDVDSLAVTTIEAGGVWHFADYGEGFFLFNGVDTVFLRNGLLLVEKGLPVQTGCYFRGRVLLAGFNPSETWKKGWHSVVNDLLADDIAAYPMLASLALEGFTGNMVWWPTIGGGDLFSLFYPENAISGYYIGLEHLTNGGFTGSAADWALTDVSYSSNTLVKAAGSVGTAIQANADLAVSLIPGQKYLLKFHISAYVAGSVSFDLGGDGTGSFNSAGTHIAYLTAELGTEDFEINFSAPADMTLDWVSLRPVLRDDSDPAFVQAHSLNQQGWWRIDHEGTIICMKQIGSAVICYGTNGISALLHYASPVPTFGEKVLLRVGIADRGAVGGSDYEHVFLDTTGKAWQLDAELKLTELDYEEYLAALVGEPITINFDSRESEYRITGRDSGSSDSPKTPLPFVLADQRLARSPEVVSSAVFVDGAFTGLREATLVEDRATLETGIYDLETRLVKHLLAIEFAYRGSDTLQAAFKYRISGTEEFVQTDWTDVDVNGYCRLPAAAVEFAVLARNTDFELAQKLDQITVYYDLRGRLNARNLFGA